MVTQNLARPFLVALEEKNHNEFDLMSKGDCGIQGLREFAGERALAVKEDVKKGFCIV